MLACMSVAMSREHIRIVRLLIFSITVEPNATLTNWQAPKSIVYSLGVRASAVNAIETKDESEDAQVAMVSKLNTSTKVIALR